MQTQRFRSIDPLRNSVKSRAGTLAVRQTFRNGSYAGLRISARSTRGKIGDPRKDRRPTEISATHGNIGDPRKDRRPARYVTLIFHIRMLQSMYLLGRAAETLSPAPVRNDTTPLTLSSV